MSALGLLASPLGFEISRSRRVCLADLDAASFEGLIAPLVEEASGFLHRAGIADPHISTRLDMRYQGQGYEIEVTLPGGGIGAGYAEVFVRLDELFRARYAEIFAETFLDEPLEIVSWKVEAAGEEAALAYAGIAGGARARSGSATPSSSARPSTATHSRWGRRSRVRPSSKSASRPACSAPATGQRWARA